MTNLGAQQCYNSGSFYRDLYIADGASNQISGISSLQADHTQLWASAPDQSVLFQTANNFLQGLYPPLSTLSPSLATEELANGTSTEAPLDGYQYIHIQGEADNAPDTIWLKGDDECPAYTNASKTYRQSAEYQATLESTQDFYLRFEDLLSPILGAENVSYAKAYDVFDLLNTANIHNSSIADQISTEDLDQARYLADSWEFNMNFNTTDPNRSIGGSTLLGSILNHLASITSSNGTPKFSLMTGSYDTFLAFFGLMGLPSLNPDFYGLPNYASTMAFELYSEADNASFPAEEQVMDELLVRLLFRNGTDAGEELKTWPLVGMEEGVRYGEFVERLRGRAVMSVGEWCGRCESEAGFCLAANGNAEGQGVGSGGDVYGKRGLSAATGGGIGAGVTLAVVGVVALLAWTLLRRRRAVPVAAQNGKEKLSRSDSESV